MKINNHKGILTLESEPSDSFETQESIKSLNNYHLELSGSTILIHAKSDKGEKYGPLLLGVNTFDNTVYVADHRSYDLASAFGAKRFLVGDARRSEHKPEAAIHFPRDLSFPISQYEKVAELEYVFVNFNDVFKLKKYHYDSEAFYTDINSLLNEKADFTTEKQKEYGMKVDKFSRYNAVSLSENFPIATLHTFMLNKKDEIIGAISASIINDGNGNIDIYFYDEVVDYASIMDAKQIADNDANLIEANRKILLGQLFSVARLHLSSVIPEFHVMIAEGRVNAFIRAAAERVSMYQELGCGAKNNEHFVIHGSATELTKQFDAYIKSWAENKLFSKEVSVIPYALIGSPRATRAAEIKLSSGTDLLLNK